MIYSIVWLSYGDNNKCILDISNQYKQNEIQTKIKGLD